MMMVCDGQGVRGGVNIGGGTRHLGFIID